MYKIAVVGDKDSVLGFKTIGIDVFPVTNDAIQIQKIIEELINKNYAIIYITEQKYQLITEFIEKQKSNIIPAIITIPSQTENLNLGLNKVKEITKKAIGMDIVLKNE